MPSNFDFFAPQWPDIAAEAQRAERYAVGDPRAALFYARRTAELAVTWMYRADHSLRRPYKDDFIALLDEPTFKRAVGDDIGGKLHLIRMRGNAAVHKPVTFAAGEAVKIVRELWFVLVWIATVYADDPAARPPAGVAFDPDLVPRPQPGLVAKTRAELAAAHAENERKDAALAEQRRENDALAAEIAALRAEVAAAKARNDAAPIAHDLDEAGTRSAYIDALLDEAGWDPHGTDVAEFPVTFADGTTGRADYVLWGDDGRPLAVVEAKRTRVDGRTGQDQARRYADALETRYGRRPVIYTSNGYETWIWDDLAAPPRPVQGFRTRAELEWLVQQRARRALAGIRIDERIAGRDYQQAAIRAIAETFDRDRQRRALVVMATGSGKTRTVVALVELLQQAGWVKRVLFLADRRALVRQAKRAFAEHLPDTTSVSLVDEPDGDARVVLSTYQTMMGLVSGGADGRRFGPGAFDLVIVDEAHRSVYRKYGILFDYFDALLVGLTATPKDEVDHNTYRLFRLEDGVPTYSYDLGRAIDDGYLVPPEAFSIRSEFLDRGIRYDERSAAEQEEWDLTDWGEDGDIPDEVDASAFNRWLFNEHTVDELLAVLMSKGHRVGGGDVLGKTIVFAANQRHAEFIKTRFDAQYPGYRGQAAKVITHDERYAERLIDEFAAPDSALRIAISVDMLDTGIDVPEVVNLVFAKLVRSKTKYWQMLGRGTRLAPDLDGPGKHKTHFNVFDAGGNVDFFNSDLPALEPTAGRSLHERLFRARVAVIAAIDAQDAALASPGDADVRQSHAEHLHGIVAGMHEGNVLVRPHRRILERFVDGDAWQSRGGDLDDALELADLPSDALAADTDEAAKRFDVLLLNAQVALASGAPVPDAVRARVRGIADALGALRAIPQVVAQADLIDEVAGAEWWDDVTLPLLELARTRLRALVRLIPADRRAPVYTDFTDVVEVGEASVVIAEPGVNRERFRAKLYDFLRAHETHVVLRKLRTGRQLTETDVAELQRMFDESGEFDEADLAAIDAEAEAAHGLGGLIRSIVGLDRAAARSVLEDYLAASLPLNSKQLAFVDLVVDFLAADGRVDPELLYTHPPFRERASGDPEDLFGEDGAGHLFEALRILDDAAAPPTPLAG